MWREELIPVNPFSRPGTPLRLVRNIVLHYTANPGASAANHVRYFGQILPQQGATYASAHLFVDPGDAVLIIPLDEMAYHASQANPYSIGIEMCIEKDGTFHPETVRRTIEIVAELCKRHDLEPQRDIIRHYDVSGKLCPKPYVVDPWQWEAFKESVVRAMKGEDEAMQKELDALKKRIQELEERANMPVPVWARTAVDVAVAAGLIDTPDGGSYDFYRVLTVLYRKGII